MTLYENYENCKNCKNVKNRREKPIYSRFEKGPLRNCENDENDVIIEV